MPRATPRVVLYNLVLLLASPLFLAVFFLQGMFDRRVREGHASRWGLKLPPKPRRTAVWVHAVSVGEVHSVRRLVEMIVAADRYDVYLSTTTATGFAAAQRIYRNRVTRFYFPVDIRFVIARFFNVIGPAAVIVTEVEIWPNFLDVARRRRVPVFLVNGRIGARELSRYRRLRWFFTPFYSMYRKVLAQSGDDRARMISIGMPGRSIDVIRNLKEDLDLTLDPGTVAAIHALIPAGRTVIVAGSTHAPEERHVLAACRSLQSAPLFVAIAPRDVRRGEEVRALCAEYGFSATLFSDARAGEPAAAGPRSALVVDTMGDLPCFYQRADIVIMGGSFSPRVGGHNILEPLYFGKPVVTGPCMQNFVDIDRRYTAQGGICKIAGPEEIGPALEDLIRDEGRRAAIGSKGRDLLASGRGGSAEAYAAIFDASGIVVRPNRSGR